MIEEENNYVQEIKDQLHKKFWIKKYGDGTETGRSLNSDETTNLLLFEILEKLTQLTGSGESK